MIFVIFLMKTVVFLSKTCYTISRETGKENTEKEQRWSRTQESN